MTRQELVAKLLAIRPGAVWNLRGDTYDGLEWLDQTQSKPTLAELYQ